MLFNREVAEEVLSIQIPAYQVEARLSGFLDIPTLRDSVESLQAVAEYETFWGAYMDEQLVGVISYRKEDELLDIYRLFVHPDHFRARIGTALLQAMWEAEAPFSRTIVSTAANNFPAIAFYEKHGFRMIKRKQIPGELAIACFEKNFD